MKAFDFSVPTRVFFGKGELGRLQDDRQTRLLTSKCDFALGLDGGIS
jgi:alcohol dehydrogenase YqhD (iron-dependent ADH family)